MNNVNLTTHLMRVGSRVKSDNFTAYDTPITHTQHCPVTRINTLCGHQVPLCTCKASPHVIPSGRVGPIAPGQVPDFDKQHADTVAPQGIDSRRRTMCVCDRCVEAVKLSLFLPDPALIKCAVKLTLFIQFG